MKIFNYKNPTTYLMICYVIAYSCFDDHNYI